MGRKGRLLKKAHSARKLVIFKIPRHILPFLEKVKQDPHIILEIGAGPTQRGEGWITLDRNSPCDVKHDLRRPLLFPPNTFLSVYCSHLLEHLHHNDILRLLDSIYNVLKPGGEFRVCVPDASIYLNAYANPGGFDAGFYCRHKPSFNFYSPIDYVNYIAYMNGNHKFMFDRENLPAMLAAAGFREVAPRAFDPRFDLPERDYESIYFIAKK